MTGFPFFRRDRFLFESLHFRPPCCLMSCLFQIWRWRYLPPPSSSSSSSSIKRAFLLTYSGFSEPNPRPEIDGAELNQFGRQSSRPSHGYHCEVWGLPLIAIETLADARSLDGDGRLWTGGPLAIRRSLQILSLQIQVQVRGCMSVSAFVSSVDAQMRSCGPLPPKPTSSSLTMSTARVCNYPLHYHQSK